MRTRASPMRTRITPRRTRTRTTAVVSAKSELCFWNQPTSWAQFRTQSLLRRTLTCWVMVANEGFEPRQQQAVTICGCLESRNITGCGRLWSSRCLRFRHMTVESPMTTQNEEENIYKENVKAIRKPDREDNRAQEHGSSV